MVPFVDLKAQYQRIKTQIDDSLADMLAVCEFVQGPAVTRFEHDFAEYCSVRAAVAVHSGAAALHLALTALDIGPGDEVIVPALAFMGTVEPIAQRGARVVFADAHPDTGAIDPRSVERCLTRRTRAIIPVHLYGHMADMDSLAALIACTGRPIHLIEDAGQAPGARQGDRIAGSVGAVGCFGFPPDGNLGAMGDAGAVTTGDLDLARRMRKLRDHGRDEKDRHEVMGYHYRLDALQAGVLTVKLGHLDRWNERRRAIAALYDRVLANVSGVARPKSAPGHQSVHHLYVIQVEDRDGLRAFLAEREIATAVHYPVPLHRQPALADVDHVAGPLPVTERWAERVLSLPIYPELTDAQVHEVAEAVRQFQTRRLPPQIDEAPIPKKRKFRPDTRDGR